MQPANKATNKGRLKVLHFPASGWSSNRLYPADGRNIAQTSGVHTLRAVATFFFSRWDWVIAAKPE